MHKRALVLGICTLIFVFTTCLPYLFSCRSLSLGSHPLLIGGVRDISTILNHTGQVSTHDFIGCVQNFTINMEDMLRREPAGSSQVTNSSCPRTSSGDVCEDFRCDNGGTCISEWAGPVCYCTPNFMGTHCDTGI